jgi:hypothetical protein
MRLKQSFILVRRVNYDPFPNGVEVFKMNDSNFEVVKNHFVFGFCFWAVCVLTPVFGLTVNPVFISMTFPRPKDK